MVRRRVVRTRVYKYVMLAVCAVAVGGGGGGGGVGAEFFALTNTGHAASPHAQPEQSKRATPIRVQAGGRSFPPLRLLCWHAVAASRGSIYTILATSQPHEAAGLSSGAPHTADGTTHARTHARSTL
jgi:hypothetical protein